MNFETPPTKSSDQIEAQSFRELFDRTQMDEKGKITTIRYELPYPKEDFLKFLVTEKNVLLHGSSSKEIEILEPRQANDRAKISGNKKAVYAVTDPVFPIFYAIQDRNKIHGLIESGVDHNPATGELRYEFKMPQSVLASEPWTRGIIYIFDRSQFNPEKNDVGEPSGEWTSEKAVNPIAKLEVGPEDFRFLDKVKGVE